MRGLEEVPLPLAAGSEMWVSVKAERTVLGVVHNITSATRLLDLLSVFAGDRRVQVVFTCTGSSALDGSITEFFNSRGMTHIPWEKAKASSFDLAIATSRGGDLENLRTPIIGTSHGAGYNKILKPETGNRKPEAFGLSPEWLMHEGRVVPAAIVLSHEEQRERLAVSCPPAVPVSVVAGDPCYDQLHASLPFRAEFRRALGLRQGQKLVVVSSTWGRGSILGADEAGKDVLRRALAELPRDSHRVLAAIHPNAWYGHGAWQLQSWLSPLIDHGLLLPTPDDETWKAALLAADVLLGDHGSLTYYGFSLRIPTILGSFNTSKVAAASPMARLGTFLPHASPSLPLLPQVEAAAARTDTTGTAEELRFAITSRPGRSAALLRRLFYERLGLPEPEHAAAVRPVPLPVVPVGATSPSIEPASYVSVHTTESRVDVSRYPAVLQRRTMERHLAGTHLVADVDDPDTSWPRSADVLVLLSGRPLHTAGPDAWVRLLRRGPGASLLAVEESTDSTLTLHRNGTRVRARWEGEVPWWASTSLAASVVHERIVHAQPSDAARSTDHVRVGLGPGIDTGLLRIDVL